MSVRRAALLVAAAAVALPGAAAAADGAALFARHCVHCHGSGPGRPGTLRLGWSRGAERALLTERRDLTPAYVRGVVRGGLYEMPPLRPTELSAAELEVLALWLTDPGRRR